jgi:hypothetical protein
VDEVRAVSLCSHYTKISSTSFPTVTPATVGRTQILRTRLGFKIYKYKLLHHITTQEKEVRGVLSKLEDNARSFYSRNCVL